MQETEPNETKTWFSCLVQHEAGKWSGSILATPQPTIGPVW